MTQRAIRAAQKRWKLPLLDEDGRKMLKSGAKYSAVGFEIAACLLLGYFGGSWLDGKLATSPYLAVAGGLIGLGAAIKVLVRLVRQTDLDKL